MILKYYFLSYHSLIFSFSIAIDTVNPMFILHCQCHWFKSRSLIAYWSILCLQGQQESLYLELCAPQWIVYRTTKHVNRIHWKFRPCNSLEQLYCFLLRILNRHHTSKCGRRRKSYSNTLYLSFIQYQTFSIYRTSIQGFFSIFFLV